MQCNIEAPWTATRKPVISRFIGITFSF